MDAFCRRLRPDALLIKASPDSLWRPPAACDHAEGAARYARVLRRSLAPAAHGACLVITDSSQEDESRAPSFFETPPDSVLFEDVQGGDPRRRHEMFGYGRRVFWSLGSNLRVR